MLTTLAIMAAKFSLITYVPIFILRRMTSTAGWTRMMLLLPGFALLIWFSFFCLLTKSAFNQGKGFANILTEPYILAFAIVILYAVLSLALRRFFKTNLILVALIVISALLVILYPVLPTEL